MPDAVQFHFAGQTPLSSDSVLVDPADLATLENRVEVRGPDDCWPYIPKGWVHAPASPEPRYFFVYVRHPDDGSKVKLTAHRVAFVRQNGPLASDLVVRHDCDNRSCCNPAHLLSGTHAENLADKARPISIARRKERLDAAISERAAWHDAIREMTAEAERRGAAIRAAKRAAKRKPKQDPPKLHGRPLPPRRRPVGAQP